MRYSNPPIPRSTQAPHAGEGREFLRLLMIVAGIFAVIIIGFDRLSYWLAPRLPFSWEVSLSHTLNLDDGGLLAATADGKPGSPTQHAAIEGALQAHVERIRRAVQVPADMPLTVHYIDGSTVNAMATLGGHLFVYRGLLEHLKYEEELDAVLAHEIGHVTHRHMMRQLSRGVTTAVALSLVGVRSPTLTRWLIGDIQQLEQLAYSRAAEREADDSAVLAANRLYSNTRGVSSLFERFEELQRARGGAYPIAFLQSHPLPEERAAAADAASASSQTSALTPLRPPLNLVPAK